MTGSSQVQDGPGEEAPRLRPGTYDLTKRVEVDENGVARFVDMPDGPNAEYVAGFWHKTRSWVRSVADEEPAPVRVIPDEIVDAAAALLKNPDTYHLTTRELAVAVLSAALAGRTVLELPEPEIEGPDGDAEWNPSVHERYPIIVRSNQVDGVPLVEAVVQLPDMSPDVARTTAAALLAAAAHAEELAAYVRDEIAASGSGVGDQHAK